MSIPEVSEIEAQGVNFTNLSAENEELKNKLTLQTAETEKWKGHSRKHESDLKSLIANNERATVINATLQESGLPDSAKSLITGKTAEEITTQVAAIKGLLGNKIQETPEAVIPVAEEIPPVTITKEVAADEAVIPPVVINPLAGVESVKSEVVNPLLDALRESGIVL